MKKLKPTNSFKMKFTAKSQNESFSRAVAGAFVSQLDPTLEELCDIKTAVSEAVTNCIVHAYDDSYPESKRTIKLEGYYDETSLLTITVKDSGCGIEDISKAMQPMYTTGNDERSGMGFSIMQCFTDRLTVKSVIGKGTTVTLKKYIGKQENDS